MIEKVDSMLIIVDADSLIDSMETRRVTGVHIGWREAINILGQLEVMSGVSVPDH